MPKMQKFKWISLILKIKNMKEICKVLQKNIKKNLIMKLSSMNNKFKIFKWNMNNIKNNQNK